MEKGSKTKKHRKQHQPSQGDSKEVTTDGYTTCREDIAELTIASIQPCPIIPDYKEPTASTLPIVVRTPVADFCIDGWVYLEQAKASGQTSIRCHVSQITDHSDTELAIRKTAIRVMPQGGKCSYAELVRNTHRLYQVLRETSDDLVLFSHGGDRRGVSFTSFRENNIRVILANRLGKSQTTINKYLQHGDNLNDAAMETMVDAESPKLFFEAFQVQKQIEIAALNAEQKDEIAITTEISNQMFAWLNEFQRSSTTENRLTKNQPHTRADQSSDIEANPSSEDQRITSVQRIHRECSGTDAPIAIESSPANAEDATEELKRIGEALIEIAANQSQGIDRRVQDLKDLITKLCRLLPWLVAIGTREDGGKGGQV